MHLSPACVSATSASIVLDAKCIRSITCLPLRNPSRGTTRQLAHPTTAHVQVWNRAVGALHMWLAVPGRATGTAGALDCEGWQAPSMAPGGATRIQGPCRRVLAPEP